MAGKGKHIDVMEDDYIAKNVSKEHQPEWYRLGITPYKVDDERLKEEARRIIEEKEDRKMNPDKPISLKRQAFPAIPVKDDEEIPKIKLSAHMEPEQESAWYDDPVPGIAPEEMIDNNDVVDVGRMQRHRVIISQKEAPASTIDAIRQKLIREEEMKKQAANPPMQIAMPGEFVVLLQNKLVNIGDLEQTKEICEKIIIENDGLGEDDLIVFLRVPLNKICK